MKTTTKLWFVIAVLMVLSPLGLLLPEYFKGGDAWGEWGVDTLKELLGYIPRGLENMSSLWKAPFADYVFGGWENKGLTHLSFAYIISAVVGIAVTAAAVLLIAKFLMRKGD